MLEFKAYKFNLLKKSIYNLLYDGYATTIWLFSVKNHYTTSLLSAYFKLALCVSSLIALVIIQPFPDILRTVWIMDN